MQLGSFSATIAGIPHTVVVLTPGPDTASPRVMQRVHRIFGIDRSGSMSLEDKLNRAIDNASAFGSGLRDGDLLSTFWFSGEGEWGPMTIGAQPSDDIGAVLNRYRRVVGLTCFSEMLVGMRQAVADHAGIVDQTVIDLFTDGAPVTSWSESEEEQRVIEAVRGLAHDLNVSAVNTIGYGNYYNADFLRRVSAATDHGQFVHSSNMAELTALFDTHTDVARDLKSERLTVTAAGCTILYVGADNLHGERSHLDMARVSATSSTVYIVAPEDSIPPMVRINDVDHPLVGLSRLKDPTLRQNFFYALANEAYYVGDRRRAFEIAAHNLHDRHLVDLMGNAHTADEVAEVQRALRLATHSADHRFTAGKTPPNYVPARNALCVMDVFSTIFQEQTPTFYVPFSRDVPGYERIGRKATDREDRFVPASDVEARSPIDEFVWNESRVNLSLRFQIPGTVRLNPRAAKDAGLPEIVPSFLWRNHTLVKDGALNLRRAELLVSPALHKRLESIAVPMTDKGNEFVVLEASEGSTQYHRIVIEFAQLPVLNRRWADTDTVSVSQLLDAVVRQTEIKAGSKIINELLGRVRAASSEAKAEGMYTGRTGEQMKVLEQHGVRRDGSYGGVASVVAKTGECDHYVVPTMEFKLKGFSNFPTVTAVEEMMVPNYTGREPTPPAAMMLNYYGQLTIKAAAASVDLTKATKETREFLVAEQKRLKHEKNEIALFLATVKAAKILTHDWFQGLTPNNKGQDEFSKDGHTLILERERKREPIDRPPAEAEAETGAVPVVGTEGPTATTMAGAA